MRVKICGFGLDPRGRLPGIGPLYRDTVVTGRGVECRLMIGLSESVSEGGGLPGYSHVDSESYIYKYSGLADVYMVVPDWSVVTCGSGQLVT